MKKCMTKHQKVLKQAQAYLEIANNLTVTSIIYCTKRNCNFKERFHLTHNLLNKLLALKLYRRIKI